MSAEGAFFTLLVLGVGVALMWSTESEISVKQVGDIQKICGRNNGAGHITYNKYRFLSPTP